MLDTYRMHDPRSEDQEQPHEHPPQSPSQASRVVSRKQAGPIFNPVKGMHILVVRRHGVHVTPSGSGAIPAARGNPPGQRPVGRCRLTKGQSGYSRDDSWQGTTLRARRQHTKGGGVDAGGRQFLEHAGPQHRCIHAPSVSSCKAFCIGKPVKSIVARSPGPTPTSSSSRRAARYPPKASGATAARRFPREIGQIHDVLLPACTTTADPSALPGDEAGIFKRMIEVRAEPTLQRDVLAAMR